MLQTAKTRNGSEAKRIQQESVIYCKTANCSSVDHKIKTTAFKSSNDLMAKAPTLSLYERGQMVALRQQGLPHGTVAAEVGHSKTVVPQA